MINSNQLLKHVQIKVKDNKVVRIQLKQQVTNDLKDPLVVETLKQLNDYLNRQRTQFDLPVGLSGTDFQIKVWKYIASIPYGSVVTYKQIAQEIGHPKAYRAVGSAVGDNPLPLVIACHRVVGCHSIGGFYYGLELKRALLSLEGICIE